MKDLENYLYNTAVVIHHGGEAKRLSTLTKEKFPKGMIEVGINSRPIFDWVLAKYVDSGIRKFYITLWFEPEAVKKRCKEIENYSGIEFKFIEEPKDRRLGRGGAIKFGIKEGIINEDNILSVNGSDIINYDVKKFVKFHVDGLDKYSVTILGSPYDKSIFGRIECEKNEVKRFVEKPLIRLREGEYTNTGIFLLDKKVKDHLLKIESYPFNLEDNVFLSELLKRNEVRCYSPEKEIVPGENWVYFKDKKDYDGWKNLDFEKFLEIKNINNLLGPYKT